MNARGRLLLTCLTGILAVVAVAGAGWAADRSASEPVVASSTRPSSLPLVQPRWNELTASQRDILAPIAPHWDSMSAVRKLAWASLATKIPAMKPAERALALERIREWAALTPEQRRMARENYRLAKRLPREDRVASWESYQQLSDDELASLRERRTSNTAARHAGARTGLAKHAARPLPGVKLPAPAPLPAVLPRGKPATEPAPGTESPAADTPSGGALTPAVVTPSTPGGNERTAASN